MNSKYANPRHPTSPCCLLGTSSTADVEPKDANLLATCFELMFGGKPPTYKRTPTPLVMVFAQAEEACLQEICHGRRSNTVLTPTRIAQEDQTATVCVLHLPLPRKKRFTTHSATNGSSCDCDGSGSCMQLQVSRAYIQVLRAFDCRSKR